LRTAIPLRRQQRRPRHGQPVVAGGAERDAELVQELASQHLVETCGDASPDARLRRARSPAAGRALAQVRKEEHVGLLGFELGDHAAQGLRGEHVRRCG